MKHLFERLSLSDCFIRVHLVDIVVTSWEKKTGRTFRASPQKIRPEFLRNLLRNFK